VTVNPDAAIALTSAVGSNAQTLVLNTSLTNITYSVTGGGTGAGVTGLPAGVAGAYNAGVFTISGTPSAAGNYSYTVTTTGTCAQTTSEGTIHVDVAPGDLTADQTICAGTVPASLELVGSVGDIVRWEKSVNSEFTVPITIAITATTLTGANMGALTTDTWFRAVVQSGTCPVAYSTIIKVAVNPLPGPTFTDQPGALSPASTDVTYATESGKSSYVWTCSGSSPTDYTITSGGGNTNSVTLKWISTGDHTVTVNYSNSTGCQAVGAAIAITNVGGTAPAVGDSYGGGKVAYILQPGEPGYVAGETHGLIAALADIYFDETSTFPWWNGTATTTGATATALGTGKANTTTIIGSPGNTGTYAAKLCRDYWIGDYYDWYLPSIDELIKIYPNWAAIGGMVGSYYWSSSEHDASQAKSQYSDGTSLNQSKSVNCYVRAIRTF
jgi:hypothetical protein